MDTYEKKLALAKEALDSGSYDKETIEYIFPELAESEDEVVRKELIKGISKTRPNTLFLDTNITREDALAWLEKQDKHNIGISETTKQKLEDNLNKPAWSEDDEELLSFCCAAIELSNYSSDEHRNYALSFLESLKDRVQPQLEWSKEDNAMLIEIEDILTGRGHSFYNKEITWLKSLRPRNVWKPSDEQIEALESTTENCAYSEYQDCLRELIEQLKKLKG